MYSYFYRKVVEKTKGDALMKAINDKISVIKGDITKLNCDAIVNAANSSLLGGGGVDGAIHYAAGPKLLEECITLNGCKVGEAKITKGYNLPAKYVIHTVGPIYSGVPEDSKNLGSCYYNSLEVAKMNEIHSIAFPGISTGVYGYPLKPASEVAIRYVKKWLEENEEYEIEVVFCVFSDQAEEVYESLMG